MRVKAFAWFLMVLLLAGVWHGTATAKSYTDGTGVSVAYGQNSRRIVSLAPNVTEMLYYVGLGGRLVGRSDFCDYPEEAQRVSSIGGFADASLERIVAIKPDLVVAYQGNDRELVDQLRQAGITVVAFKEAATLNAILETMRTLSAIAGDEKPKPASLDQWAARLQRLAVPAGGSRPSVFFGYPGEISTTCGPGTFIDDLITLAGGKNVVSAAEQRWPMVSAEYILGAKPQWIITATACTGEETVDSRRAAVLKQLKADAVWSAVPAVAAGRVIVLDSDVLLRPGPRILDALEQVRGALHPELK